MATLRAKSWLSRLSDELGVKSMVNSSIDVKYLCLQRFVRLFAYGSSTLILVLYLSSLHISDSHIGLFMTLTLLGDVVISFVLTLFADGLGRRKILAFGAAMMSASGVVFALSGNYWVLVVASIIGVISPSGNEIGPFRAIEESTLAQLTPSQNRSDVFAWYTLIGTAGSALGTISCGWITESLQDHQGWSPTRTYRVIFWIYAMLGLIKFALSFLLSTACEADLPRDPRNDIPEANDEDARDAEGLLHENEDEDEHDDTNSLPMTPKSPTPLLLPKKSKKKSIWPEISRSTRTILMKLCLLFAIDSGASGLVPASWVTYFFKTKFSLAEGKLGTLFFTTSIIQSLANLVASSISKRIGLLKTMVFTHLPSALWLSLIPLPSNVYLAETFLVLRSSTSSMDQAPRQAFLAAVVLPHERTAVMGVVNVVKTLSQSVGPSVTGWLAGVGKFWIAFLAAGCMKACYDLGMLAMFVGHRTEEDGKAGRERESESESASRAGGQVA
ncbi:hypothetical protein MMC09_003708 [Bachmanniomyces sp. S44760]|nr:hypothetical protein [Bachmanniomyces sp. S44760]